MTVHAGWSRGRGPVRVGWSYSSFVHPSPLDLGNSSLLCVERVWLSRCGTNLADLLVGTGAWLPGDSDFAV